MLMQKKIDFQSTCKISPMHIFARLKKGEGRGRSQKFSDRVLHFQPILDFPSTHRSRNDLFSWTYPLIISHPWSFYMRIHYMRVYFWSPYLSHITRSNCTVISVYNDHTCLGTLNLLPLLTGGCCSEEALCHKNLNWDF